MKRKYVPIITLSLAILLVGSAVYASDKRKKAKQSAQDPNDLSEETLKAELLTAPGNQYEKLSVTKAAGSDKDAAADKRKSKKEQ